MIYNVIDRKRKKKENPYLTFSAPKRFTIGFDNPGWNGTMEVSTDTVNWKEYTGGNVDSVLSGGQQKVFFRGKNNTVIVGESKFGATGVYVFFIGELAPVSCDGSIETLLDYELYLAGEHPPMEDYCFSGLFGGFSKYGGPNMSKPPKLTSPILSKYCYLLMFRNCGPMESLPSLPATELPEGCYAAMFQGCSNIKVSAEKSDEYTIPYRIPSIGDAETVGENCLAGIFGQTGGTYQGDASANTTYWLHKDNSVV